METKVTCNRAILLLGEHYYTICTEYQLFSSQNQLFSVLKCLFLGYNIVQLSASKSGDCHCLALANNGDVFSWGEGELGRLGHGDTYKQRRPKKIEALKGKNVVMVT